MNLESQDLADFTSREKSTRDEEKRDGLDPDLDGGVWLGEVVDLVQLRLR